MVKQSVGYSRDNTKTLEKESNTIKNKFKESEDYFIKWRQMFLKLFNKL